MTKIVFEIKRPSKLSRRRVGIKPPKKETSIEGGPVSSEVRESDSFPCAGKTQENKSRGQVYPPKGVADLSEKHFERDPQLIVAGKPVPVDLTGMTQTGELEEMTDRQGAEIIPIIKPILGARKLFLNLFILTVLAAQIYAAFIYHPDYFGDSTYPFLNYPMYNEVKRDGEIIPNLTLYGITSEEEIIPIKMEEFRLDYFKFEWKFLDLEVNRDNLRPEIIKKYLNWYQMRTGKEVKTLRLENSPMMLTSNGVQRMNEINYKYLPLGHLPEASK